MAGKLHGKIARKPVGALDEDYPHAIASDPVEHGLKAGALVDWVRSGHNVIEFVDDGVAVSRGKADDRRPLALVAVLVGRQPLAGVCRRRRPQVSNRLYLLACHD